MDPFQFSAPSQHASRGAPSGSEARQQFLRPVVRRASGHRLNARSPARRCAGRRATHRVAASRVPRCDTRGGPSGAPPMSHASSRQQTNPEHVTAFSFILWIMTSASRRLIGIGMAALALVLGLVAHSIRAAPVQPPAPGIGNAPLTPNTCSGQIDRQEGEPLEHRLDPGPAPRPRGRIHRPMHAVQQLAGRHYREEERPLVIRRDPLPEVVKPIPCLASAWRGSRRIWQRVLRQPKVRQRAPEVQKSPHRLLAGDHHLPDGP